MKLLICSRISISAIDWAKLDPIFENIFESFESLQIVWKYHLTLELVIIYKKREKEEYL